MKSIIESLDIIKIIPDTVERSWQVGSFQALEEFVNILPTIT